MDANDLRKRYYKALEQAGFRRHPHPRPAPYLRHGVRRKGHPAEDNQGVDGPRPPRQNCRFSWKAGGNRSSPCTSRFIPRLGPGRATRPSLTNGSNVIPPAPQFPARRALHILRALLTSATERDLWNCQQRSRCKHKLWFSLCTKRQSGGIWSTRTKKARARRHYRRLDQRRELYSDNQRRGSQ